MKIRRKSKAFISFQGILDLLIVYISYYLAIFPFNRFNPGNIKLDDFIVLIPFILVISFVLFEILGVFEYGEHTYVEMVVSIGIAGMITNAIAVIIAFALNETLIPIKLFGISFVIEMIIFVPYKYLAFRLYGVILKAKKIIIVGSNEEIIHITQKSNKNLNKSYQIIGKTMDIDLLEERLINETEAIFIMPSVNEKQKLGILELAIQRNKGVFISPDLYEISINHSKLMQIDDIPMFYLKNYQLQWEERVLKRILDILISILCIFLLWPLILIVAIGIKVNDRGPIVYKQERLTRDRNKFYMLKFRTMIIDAEKNTGPLWAIEQDPRITKFGAFLRKTHIDELPQILNVLKGEMSIVGPRPEREHFIEAFEKTIPNFSYRLSVKAGITGLAQVLGKYTTTPEDKLKFDLMYITSYSIILDIKIILQTLRVIFSE